MKECILAWLKYTFSFAFFYISGTSAAKKNLSKFGFQWCWQHVGWARKAIPNTCFRRRCAHAHECVRSERKAVAKEGDSTLVHGHMYQRTRCWAAPTHKINSKLVLQTLSSPGGLREGICTETYSRTQRKPYLLTLWLLSSCKCHSARSSCGLSQGFRRASSPEQKERLDSPPARGGPLHLLLRYWCELLQEAAYSKISEEAFEKTDWLFLQSISIIQWCTLDMIRFARTKQKPCKAI